MTAIALTGALGPNSLRAVPQAGISAKDVEDARRVGKEFEEMFLSEMLGPVFESVPIDEYFGGGHGERMFRSLQVNEYAKGIVRNGGVGIADAVARELIALQEKANG